MKVRNVPTVQNKGGSFEVNALSLKDERIGDNGERGSLGRMWESVVESFGGVLLCVGSVSALLFQSKADHTGRQTFGWAECLSLSSQ